MNYKYDGVTYIVGLEDDGTLDTLISVNGEVFRFDSEGIRKKNGDLTKRAIIDAIETYLDSFLNYKLINA